MLYVASYMLTFTQVKNYFTRSLLNILHGRKMFLIRGEELNFTSVYFLSFLLYVFLEESVKS
jgi:hypothetical protein